MFWNRRKQYQPYYYSGEGFHKEKPYIYNAEGRRMDFFFIRDYINTHDPYGHNKYFLWDRYNWHLDVHFYTHNAMLETVGEPLEKYGMLIESKDIVPDNYQIFHKHKGLETEFKYIFTYDSELLNSIKNAKFFPGCCNVWYGRQKDDTHLLSEIAYQNKTKNISIVSSEKSMCKLHDYRIMLARKCRQEGIADAYGTFDGGSYISIDDSLRAYRYSIGIENSISDYFFTEKITNCFAAQTIPIYMGATKIDDFFNPEGIIKINLNDYDHIADVLKQCTEQEYERRLPAILDNYKRVQKYLNSEDYLYEQYFM